MMMMMMMLLMMLLVLMLILLSSTLRRDLPRTLCLCFLFATTFLLVHSVSVSSQMYRYVLICYHLVLQRVPD